MQSSASGGGKGFFKENPHPDPKAILELGIKLSMDCNQVKFWFQNRRKQVKLKSKYDENGTLKKEIDKLHIEQHIALKEAMYCPICDRFGNQTIIADINVDEQQTKIEHDWLKDKVKRIIVEVEKLLGPLPSLGGSMASMMANSNLGFATGRNGIGGMNVVDTASLMGLDFGNVLSSPLSVITPQLITSLVNEKVPYELLRLAEIDEPLCVKSLSGGGEPLNLEEYASQWGK